MPQKLILDVDTGTDDAVALMCAALHPELDLLAATTVNGNVPVETCTDNSLRVFDHIGVPVPVYQGMHRPMVRDDFPVPRGVGRSDVHGGTLDIPPAHSRAADGHAVDFLIETFMASDGDIVLVPVGPLTESVDLVWKQLHGPGEVQGWPGGFPNATEYHSYWMESQI